MKKTSVLIILLFFISTVIVFAQETKLKDVSDDHWAAKAVYEMIRAGVMSGFPDGTFRGDQKLSRYEAAVLISKVAQLAGLTEGLDIPTIYKAQVELKAELDSLRAKLKKSESAFAGVLGMYQTEYRSGNFVSSSLGRTPAASYRLRTSLIGKPAETAEIKLNLDTMDAGYNGGGEALVSQLLDVEGKLVSETGFGSPLELKVFSGPGPRTIVSDARYPVRSGEIYLRPRSGIELSTQLGETDLGGGYTARGMSAGSPNINVNHFKGYFKTGVGQVPYLGEVKIAGGGDVLMKGLAVSNANLRANLGLAVVPAEGVEIEGMVGMGDLKRITAVDALALSASINLKDYFKTGTDISIAGLKAGANYLPDVSFDAADLVGLNVFNKYNQTGFLNLDSKVTQRINENLEISGKGNIILSGLSGYGASYAGTSLTLSGGVAYKFAPQASLDVKYSVLNDPAAAAATSDLATLGLLYKF